MPYLFPASRIRFTERNHMKSKTRFVAISISSFCLSVEVWVILWPTRWPCFVQYVFCFSWSSSSYGASVNWKRQFSFSSVSIYAQCVFLLFVMHFWIHLGSFIIHQRTYSIFQSFDWQVRQFFRFDFCRIFNFENFLQIFWNSPNNLKNR